MPPYLLGTLSLLSWTRNGFIPMIGRHYAFIHKLLHLVLPEQVATHCTSMVSLPMQEQRDLLVLLVESDVDVDELGEKATLRIMEYSYWYFLEKNI